MKKYIILIIFLLAFSFTSYSAETNTTQNVSGHITNNYVDIYKEITKTYIGNWKKDNQASKANNQTTNVYNQTFKVSGQTFMIWQSQYIKKSYFWILLLTPIIFLLHYLIIGPKKFSHEGESFLVYRALTRLIHWIAAISFSILVISGLAIIFGKVFGGGNIIRNFRYIHAPAAAVFVPSSVIMFLMWLKDMIIAPGDISWFLKFGGYLSKKNIIMNVGKFNPGQKMWFWLATIGGFVMAYTGRYLFKFSGNLDSLRFYALTHNILGMALVAMFMVHLYMSVFAIKGSLQAMFTGKKHEEELKIMHCRYYKKLSGKDCSDNSENDVNE